MWFWMSCSCAMLPTQSFLPCSGRVEGTLPSPVLLFWLSQATSLCHKMSLELHRHPALLLLLLLAPSNPGWPHRCCHAGAGQRHPQLCMEGLLLGWAQHCTGICLALSSSATAVEEQQNMNAALDRTAEGACNLQAHT